jgi:hypothetical protein
MLHYLTGTFPQGCSKRPIPFLTSMMIAPYRRVFFLCATGGKQLVPIQKYLAVQ